MAASSASSLRFVAIKATAGCSGHSARSSPLPRHPLAASKCTTRSLPNYPRTDSRDGRPPTAWLRFDHCCRTTQARVRRPVLRRSCLPRRLGLLGRERGHACNIQLRPSNQQGSTAAAADNMLPLKVPRSDEVPSPPSTANTKALIPVRGVLPSTSHYT